MGIGSSIVSLLQSIAVRRNANVFARITQQRTICCVNGKRCFANAFSRFDLIAFDGYANSVFDSIESFKITIEGNAAFLVNDEVFTIGDATGNWDGTKMTPNSDGIFVSEAFTAGGELRAYVKVSGVEWWQSEFTYNKNDNKIVWRTDKQNIQFNWTDLGDEYSIDCAAGQKLYVDFKNGTAEVK